MLSVRGLNAYYGKSHILQGVDLDVAAGEVVSLLGRNGVGRSTTIKAIMGEVSPIGTVRFKGQNIAGWPSYRIARLGLGYVPEHRDIFPSLTVRQNLALGQKQAGIDGRWRLDDMLAMFPNLQRRADNAAGVLSGGEKQMLTMCRTLMGDPELIMIDEPTAGMSLEEARRTVALIRKISRGRTVVIIEHDMGVVFDLADTISVLVYGQVIATGPPAAIKASLAVQDAYLGTVAA